MTTQITLGGFDKRGRETEDYSLITTKKRKVEKTVAGSKVDPTELASAFALASLASISSIAPTESRYVKNREEKCEGVHKVESFEEARSPKTEEFHVSPERRVPGSPERAQALEIPKMPSAPSTPQDSGIITLARKVHFAPNTKHRAISSFPSPPMRPSQSPRSLVVPPRPTAHRPGMVMPLHSPYGARHSFGRYPSTQYSHPRHQPHHIHLPPQHVYHPRAWYHGRMYPPQSLMQPPLLHQDNQWICDYCNVASFSTYEEACDHENICKLRHSNSNSLRNRSEDDERMGIEASHSTPKETIHKGSTSLAIENSDKEWLSEINCSIRKDYVEAFSATEADVCRSSKRGKISLDQVGIRCKFCKDCPLKNKAVGAVSFPNSIAGIYESVKRWQRVHLEVCEAIPQDVRTNLAALASKNTWVPTTRHYWSDSAKALGLKDTHDGIRFGKPVTECHSSLVSFRPSSVVIEARTVSTGSEANSSSLDSEEASPKDIESQKHVVFPADQEMIPSYVYFLMRQVEPCRFTEADRFVARSKGPVGYPGFQCRHCNGHAGLGKYFPVSSKSLSTNSTSQNIHAHLLKCRKCPEHIKGELVQLKIEKSRSPRLEPGWRKVFFDKVWGRLHH